MIRVLLLLSLCGVAWGQDVRAWANAVVEKRLKAAEKAPEFPGAGRKEVHHANRSVW